MNNSDSPTEKIEKINLDLFLENEKQREKIKKLEAEKSKLKSEEEDRAGNSVEVNSLQRRIADLEAENAKLLSLTKNGSDSEIRIKQLEEKISELEIRNQELMKAKEENAELRRKVTVLNTKLQENSSSDDKALQTQLQEARTAILKKDQTIHELEEELVELDRKYDSYIITLKKNIKSLEEDVARLEQKNVRLSNSNFSHLRPKSDDRSTESDLLLDKMKQMLRSWPGGIKLRNLAMSMGISVSVTNEFLEILEEENFVRIDREHAVNSNPVIFPK